MLFIYYLLILMVCIWSFSFVVVDIALEFIPPLSIALYRFILASLVYFVIDIVLKIKKRNNPQEILEQDISSRFTRYEWLYVLIGSITGVTIFFYTQYTAIEILGPSLPALFVCLLAPVLITIFALFFFNEKLNKFKIIGFIIATIGGFLLVTGGNIENLIPTSPNFIGYLFALLTPLSWAIYSTVTKKISPERSRYKINKYIAYMGFTQLLVLVLLSGEYIIFLQNMFKPIVLLSAAYLGIASFFVGNYIWQRSQNELKSSKAASFLYVEPFITLIFSMILQRAEVIVLWNVVGGIIVLIAVLIITYK